jgi:hypothetical protein
VIEGFDLNKAGFDRKMRDFLGSAIGSRCGCVLLCGAWIKVAGMNYSFLQLLSSGLLCTGNGLKPIDRAFAGRFPFSFGHVRSGVPELHACRQTLATAAGGFRQCNTRASAGGQSGGNRGGGRG